MCKDSELSEEQEHELLKTLHQNKEKEEPLDVKTR
jgi:hypothetical protein